MNKYKITLKDAKLPLTQRQITVRADEFVLACPNDYVGPQEIKFYVNHTRTRKHKGVFFKKEYEEKYIDEELVFSIKDDLVLCVGKVK